MRNNAYEVSSLSTTALALMGDAIHSVYVRKMLITAHDFKSAELSKREMQYVSARAQAKMLGKLLPLLTDDEKEIVRRGRQKRANNKPKNAGWSEYLDATAFETLLGWLYLSDKTERLKQLLDITNREEENL